MKTPLLQTKLYIPLARPELVPRPRLIERLNTRPHRKLTLVSAPAGFGKTTLITEWLRCTGAVTVSLRHVAWLSLDEDDNDPARFFTYLVAALQGIDPNIGQAAQAMLQAPQPPPPQAPLASLINDIAATPAPFVLVLDDYHLIDAPPIHQQLAFLLQHQPPSMHLTLLTRADPPLPLSRLRARSQLVEIRTDDLRFSAGETTVFLNQVMGLDLSAEDAAALEARTEGWAVGLQLAALSLRDQEDAAAFIRAFSGSHHFILDYLMDEVLDRQPQAVHEFLLRTSILERMTGALCDAVCSIETDTTANTDATGQTTLEMLHKSNLFVVPLDTERRWYRYHHLFAGLLRARLRQSRPGLVVGLNARASRWYEEHGLASEAIRHAMAAQNFDRAASLIEQHAMLTYQRGEIATLFNWINALPDPVARRHPGIRIWYSWLLASTGQLENAESLLGDVEQHIRPDDLSTQAQSWRGGMAVVRAISASRKGDAPETIRQALLALDHLPQDNPLDRAHRITAGYLLGRGYLNSGDLVKAEQTFADTAELSRAAQTPFSTAMNLSELAKLRVIRGHLHQAADLYRECQRLSISPEGRPLPWMGIAKIGLGRLMREWNELDQARHLLADAIRDGERQASRNIQASGHTALAGVLHAQGDVDGARDALQKAARVLEKSADPDAMREWEVRQVQWWLNQGDVSAARRWADERQLAPGDIPNLAHELAHISLARVLIARRDFDAALDLLARLASGAEAGGRTGRWIEILILRAMSLQAQNKTSQALDALAKSLTLAQAEGYTRIFVDEGAQMAALLHQADAQGITPGYVGKLLAAFGDLGIEKRPVAQNLVEPLSERELELLRLVAQGLSNREIAARLFIALGTVKSHVHNIYGKLNVRNRAQAVARSKELELV